MSRCRVCGPPPHRFQLIAGRSGDVCVRCLSEWLAEDIFDGKDIEDIDDPRLIKDEFTLRRALRSFEFAHGDSMVNNDALVEVYRRSLEPEE